MSDTERASLIGEMHGIQHELDSAEFPCGDWKLNKVLEYERLGKECPYTEEEMNAYFSLRQSKRDRINEIRALLKEESEK